MPYKNIIIIISLLVALYVSYKLISKSDPPRTAAALDIDKEIEYNLKNKKKVETYIIEHLDKLKESYGKSDFRDYCDYIQKNCFLFNKDNNSIKYYTFILEKINTNFVTRAHVNLNYINLTWTDMIKDTDHNFINDKYTTDHELIENMHNSNAVTHHGTMSYYWVDYISASAVRKVTLFYKLPPYTNSSGEHIEGAILGMGYNAENLSALDRTSYYNRTDGKYITGLIWVTILIMGTFYYFKTEHYKIKILSLFLIISIYLYTYLNIEESSSGVETELSKIDSINAGMASVSFLAAFNIYILTTMYKKYNNFEIICKETIIITCASMFVLLCAIFKITNYEVIGEIVAIRVSKQMLFNYTVILNFFILLNFIIFIVTLKNSSPLQ